MRVHSAFLADQARIRDGLVYVIGGFPETWSVESLPATTRLTLVVVFELTPDEPDAAHDFGVEMWQNSSGEQVATAHVVFGSSGDPVAGAPKYRSVVMSFVAQVRYAGPCEVRLMMGGVPLATVPFAIRIV